MRRQLQAALKAGLKRPLSRRLDLRSAREFYDELDIELPRLLRPSDFTDFHRKLADRSRRSFRSWRKASQQTLAHRLHYNTLETLLANGWREDIQQVLDSARCQLQLAETVEAEIDRIRIRQRKAESVSLDLYRLYASDRTEADYQALESAIQAARHQIGFTDSYHPDSKRATDEWFYSDLRQEPKVDGTSGSTD